MTVQTMVTWIGTMVAQSSHEQPKVSSNNIVCDIVTYPEELEIIFLFIKEYIPDINDGKCFLKSEQNVCNGMVIHSGKSPVPLPSLTKL